MLVNTGIQAPWIPASAGMTEGEGSGVRLDSDPSFVTPANAGVQNDASCRREPASRHSGFRLPPE
jgi:hypothetical protein